MNMTHPCPACPQTGHFCGKGELRRFGTAEDGDSGGQIWYIDKRKQQARSVPTMDIREKFARLGIDNAPGQEALQKNQPLPLRAV